MENKLKIHYDEEADFLEISVGKPANCYAVEIKPSIFIRKDEKTNEVRSIGIIDFKQRSKNLHEIYLELPVKISMNVA